MKNEKSLLPYVIIILCFVPVAFFISFNITERFVSKDIENNNLKIASKIIEETLKVEFLEKKYRFTTLFNSENKSFFNTTANYKTSYRYFNDNSDKFYKNIDYKLNYIKKYLNEKSSLPVFLDNNSEFMFYPVAYIKYENSNELISQLGNIFKNNYQELQLNKESIVNSKFLNYVYIEYKNSRNSILLISSPLDPDPLYPDNKRSFLIINNKENNNTKKSLNNIYIRSFIIDNFES